MAWIMPEIAIQRLVQYGVAQLRKDQEAFNEIFAYQRVHPLMSRGYGPAYVDRIWQWFTTEKIRTVHAWILSPQTVPCFSIHLASDTENENYSAISDHYGDEDDSDVGVSSFNVMIDIGIHGNKAADEVLWMYYILSYILFKYKPVAQDLGIEIQTYSASDWQKESSKMPENIWTRWVRMRCSVWHTWKATDFEGPYCLETEVLFERAEDE
jgi:hypothetical protein